MSKKIIAALVAVIVVLVGVIVGITLGKDNTQGMFGNNTSTQEPSDDKWLLISETEVGPSGDIYYEEHYEYDTEGHLIKNYQSYDGINKYNSFDFKYDKTGRLASKSVEDFDDVSMTIKSNVYVYEYDNNGNCTKKTINYFNGNERIYEHTYDTYGNIVKEVERNYENSTLIYTKTTTKELSYENDKCIQSKTSVDDGTANYVAIEKYQYNDYGLLVSKAYYTDFSVSGNQDDILVDGVSYGLFSTTNYMYTKLSDIILNSDVVETTDESTTVATRLSDSCDNILATGTNSNGDYYEIVSNTSEDYTGLTILVGVIKNNEWLLEPTKDMPFVLKENGFSNNAPETGEINYIGNACFVSTKKHNSSKHDFTTEYMYIVYNVETGKSYSTADYDWAFKNQVPLIKDNKENHMIIGYENYSQLTKFYVLNKTNMDISTINIDKSISYLSPISDGIFSVATGKSNYPDYYFYDLKGNVVLDLSEYKMSNKQTIYFSNGNCKFKVINDNDTVYEITIDKTGEVIDSYKVTS